MEGEKVCVVTPELLEDWADAISTVGPQPDYGVALARVSLSLRNVARTQSKSWAEWIAKDQRDRDLDRLCVLAAPMLESDRRTWNGRPEWKYAVNSIAESCSEMLSELKERVK